METTLGYLGRILFGGYFVFSALNHFTNVSAMAGYAQSKGVPFPRFAVLGTGVLLFIGGAAILLNTQLAVGLIALVLFLLPVTFLMHGFWKIQDPMARMGEVVNFSKNLALLGAVLVMLAGIF